MVLVVVTVQPVASDRLKVLKTINEFAHLSQIFPVFRIIHRISLRHTTNATVLDIGVASQSNTIDSPPSVQKYSRPRLVLVLSGTMSGLQFLKFWIRPTLTSGSWT